MGWTMAGQSGQVAASSANTQELWTIVWDTSYESLGVTHTPLLSSPPQIHRNVVIVTQRDSFVSAAAFSS